MFGNYTAILDIIAMLKHLFFYGFLHSRWRSSVGGLIYLLRCLLFTAWHTNCSTKLVRSFLLVKVFLRDDYYKKALFQVKTAFTRTIVTFKFIVSSRCFMYSVGVFCTYLHVARIIADYLFGYSEAEASRYINSPASKITL